MTSISQYLRAERVDPNEPASFYIPGSAGWNAAGNKEMLAKRIDPDTDGVFLMPAPRIQAASRDRDDQ